MNKIDGSLILKYCTYLAKSEGKDFYRLPWDAQAVIRKRAVASIRKGEGMEEAREALSKTISCPECGHILSPEDLNDIYRAHELLNSLNLPSDEPFGTTPDDGAKDSLGKHLINKKLSAKLAGGEPFERVDEVKK